MSALRGSDEDLECLYQLGHEPNWHTKHAVGWIWRVPPRARCNVMHYPLCQETDRRQVHDVRVEGGGTQTGGKRKEEGRARNAQAASDVEEGRDEQADIAQHREEHDEEQRGEVDRQIHACAKGTESTRPWPWTSRNTFGAVGWSLWSCDHAI